MTIPSFEYDLPKNFDSLSEYEQQAVKFLNETKTVFKIRRIHRAYRTGQFPQAHDVYTVGLYNDKHSYTFTFHDSVANSEANRNKAFEKKPSAYDVLACLTKSEPTDDVDEFAAEYGYTGGKIKETIRIHRAAMNEWENVRALWTDSEIENFQEIN